MSLRMHTAQACSTAPAELGEGVGWDAIRRELLWVDILGRRVHRARLSDGVIREATPLQVDRHVGVAVPAEIGGWMLGAGQGFAHLSPEGGFRLLAEPEAATAGARRMNDGACDPQGRFWLGSMAYDAATGAGSLYRLDLDGSVHTMIRGLTISNGIAWSPDGEVMYLVDTPTGRVDAFDFETSSGSISGRRPVISVAPDQGSPDGICVDAEGCLWVALWGGGAVQRHDPSGRLLERVSLPVSQPTSCAFGGTDGATLFISTAWTGLDRAARAAEPDAGRIFCASVGVSGPPLTPYRGGPA